MIFHGTLGWLAIWALASGTDELRPLRGGEITRVRALTEEALASGDASEEQYLATVARLDTDPCKNFTTGLSPSDKVGLELALAKNLSVESVEVYSVITNGFWFVIHSNISPGDSTYGFYPVDPRKGGEPVAMWAGAAPIYEVGDIVKWTTENVPRVPVEVAECFAWSVTLAPE